MSVYVDECRLPFKGKLWCHMMADTEGELHQFARTIRLKAEWFQQSYRHPHYDLSPSMRTKAIKAGAIPIKNILTTIRCGNCTIKRRIK